MTYNHGEKITALIAVRKGSKRIKNKNIKKFGDSSLLEIKIKQAVNCSLVDEIIVSSDCDEMLSIAKEYGVTVDKRPYYYCSDGVKMNDVYEYLSSKVKTEHVAYLHVTSPLLKNESLENAIKKYKSLDMKYDSLATVELIKKYIWHEGKAINYNPDKHPRSQDLPDYMCLNFAVNIITKRNMKLNKNIVGKNFFPFFISEVESIDVDNTFDFDIAEYFYNRK